MASRKRVLFFLSNLYGGGAQRTMVNILRHLDQSRFDASLVLLDYNPKQAFARDVPDGVSVLNLNSRGRFAVWKIARLLREQQPDIAISTLPQVNAAVSLAHWLSSSQSRLVLRETNYRGRDSGGSFVGRQMARFGYRRCNQAIALSNGLADEMKRLYGLNGHKVQAINNPVDLEFIRKRSEEQGVIVGKKNAMFHMISCGSLTKQKHFAMLLSACSRLADDTKWHLWLLGEGPLEDELKLQAKNLGIEDKVSFLGFQENPFIYMISADLFVLSSLWEGFPNVILEAMACGTPVLATDCPYGPREILGDNQYGWLVPGNDPARMAEQMEYLMGRPQELQDMAVKARERAADFDAKVVVKEYERLLAGG